MHWYFWFTFTLYSLPCRKLSLIQHSDSLDSLGFCSEGIGAELLLLEVIAVIVEVVAGATAVGAG